MEIVDDIIKRVKNLTVKQQNEILDILKDWQTGKQREYQRLSRPLEIDVLIGDRVVQTDVRDISASGVYIKTRRQIKAEKDVRVVFSVPGTAKPFKLEGRVVRSDPGGLAVEFIQITPYFKKILDDAIWSGSQKKPTGDL